MNWAREDELHTHTQLGGVHSVTPAHRGVRRIHLQYIYRWYWRYRIGVYVEFCGCLSCIIAPRTAPGGGGVGCAGISICCWDASHSTVQLFTKQNQMGFDLSTEYIYIYIFRAVYVYIHIFVRSMLIALILAARPTHANTLRRSQRTHMRAYVYTIVR